MSRTNRITMILAALLTVGVLVLLIAPLATRSSSANQQTFPLSPGDDIIITCDTELTGSVSGQQAIIACAPLPATSEPTATLTSPEVVIVGVVDGQTINGTVVIEAQSTSADVTRVEFKLDGPNPAIHTEKISPYFFMGDDNGVARGWDTTTFANGDYTLTVTMTDSAGNSGSQTVRLTIANAAPTQTAESTAAPTQTTEPTVAPTVAPTRVVASGPILVQAEDYIAGGEGVGYHETTRNDNRNVYRTDDRDVDTASCGTGCYRVNYIASGEWLQHTITIPQDGAYRFTGRAASLYRRKSMHLEIDGNAVSPAVEVPYSGNWNSWKEFDLGTMQLSAGQHSLRMVFDTDGFDLDWVKLEPVATQDNAESVATQVPATQAPATQVPATQVPATQAPAATNTPLPTATQAPVATPAPDSGGTGAAVSFTPSEIAFSNDELVNPSRGLFKWGGGEVVTVPGGAQESYLRFTWKELEPSRDSYNFTPIDNALKSLKQGERFSFRIRALRGNNAGMDVPDYLASLMPNGFWRNGSYIPDWDDPDFTDRARKLLLALGKRYNNDPRINYIDIGLYGKYGEWHMWPEWTPVASEATKRAIIDAHLEAFPNKRLLMMSGDAYGIRYAFSKSNTVGLRRDSLGDPTFSLKGSAAWDVIQDRWKVAPLVTEYFGSDRTDASLAVSQVKEFHVAMVSNGNLGTNSYNKADVTEAGKRSGYRFVLSTMQLPATMNRNGSFTIQTNWANRGITPAYDPWNVMFELRTAQNETVWAGQSSVNLQSVLPTDGQAVKDSFQLPGTITPGSYDVIVVIRDPAAYRLPLKLAISGQRDDGSYKLGTVIVN